MTPDFIEAVLDDRRDDAAALLAIAIPDEFPSQGERGFLRMRLNQMRTDPRWQAWCPHAVVLDGVMIGHAGYHGPPGINSTRNEAAVEFGYKIFPPWRGQGYATRAAEMLIDLAEQRAGIRHFVLAVAPNNDPSLAIVHKLGFVRTGEQWDEEDGLEHIFELSRAASASRAAPPARPELGEPGEPA